MNKKISLLILFAVLIFLPALTIEATQVYVGVQISNTENPDGETFNLLSGTQLSILNGAPPGSTTVSGSSVTTTSDTVIGDTIWTPPINLTSGSQYTARLNVPLCFGDGKYDERGPYCWYKGNDGQPCTTYNGVTGVCESNGTTPIPNSCYNFNTGQYDAPCCQEPDPSCTIMTAFGLNCTNCYNGEYFPYFYLGGNYCYNGNYSTLYGVDTYGDVCNFGYSGYTRICACQFQTGAFNFGFTANF